MAQNDTSCVYADIWFSYGTFFYGFEALLHEVKEDQSVVLRLVEPNEISFPDAACVQIGGSVLDVKAQFVRHLCENSKGITRVDVRLYPTGKMAQTIAPLTTIALVSSHVPTPAQDNCFEFKNLQALSIEAAQMWQNIAHAL